METCASSQCLWRRRSAASLSRPAMLLRMSVRQAERTGAHANCTFPGRPRPRRGVARAPVRQRCRAGASKEKEIGNSETHFFRASSAATERSTRSRSATSLCLKYITLARDSSAPFCTGKHAACKNAKQKRREDYCVAHDMLHLGAQQQHAVLHWETHRLHSNLKSTSAPRKQ